MKSFISTTSCGRASRGVVCAAVVVMSISQLTGCRTRADAHASSASTPEGVIRTDTLRGIVAITGSEPLTMVQLTTTDGAGWRLEGDSLSALRAATGLEVMVRGAVRAPEPGSRPDASRPGARFTVVHFAVRRADGVAAQDGVLERQGNGFALRLADDRRATLVDVPMPLRERVGARIWWAGPLDRAPIAYGMLTAGR